MMMRKLSLICILSFIATACGGSGSGISVERRSTRNGAVNIVVISRVDSVEIKSIKPYGNGCNYTMQNINDTLKRGESKEYYMSSCDPNEVTITTDRGSSSFTW